MRLNTEQLLALAAFVSAENAEVEIREGTAYLIDRRNMVHLLEWNRISLNWMFYFY
jgi:hypothetical protein